MYKKRRYDLGNCPRRAPNNWDMQKQHFTGFPTELPYLTKSSTLKG